MIACVRPPAPPVLQEGAAKWTSRYVESNKRFTWPIVGAVPLNQLLLPALRGMTADHCAYCDTWPAQVTEETIDHFRPKASHRTLAFEWENLFLACHGCQKEKHDQFGDLLLNPSDARYSFEAYFIVNYADGTLEPNPAATPHDQQRAKFTIELLGLNRRQLPTARRSELRRAKDEAAGMDRPYRYL